MRHFSRDEWYFDGVTWCGTSKYGMEMYPFSYGDNGRAWGMTRDIQQCLNNGTIQRAKDQICAELKYDPFFRYHYVKLELVYIKEYPTFYFDYLTIAKKLKINIDSRWHSEELVPHLMKYGFEPISTNPKIIEVRREVVMCLGEKDSLVWR